MSGTLQSATRGGFFDEWLLSLLPALQANLQLQL